MNFLKNLFGGGDSSRGDDQGFYVYVKPKMCQEIVKVRIDMMNSLSRMDDGEGYFVRKTARGQRCPFAAEMTLYFDDRRTLIDRQIDNGEFVTEAEYTALYGDSDSDAG